MRQRLDHFMGQALGEYYNNKDPLGVDGDFTTAPEISQLFGEIIGIWAVQQWISMGSPQKFNLIELGPGRGTLMSDLLRGTKHIAAFHKAMSIHMVETSDSLKSKQQNLLKEYDYVSWHDHLENIDKSIPAIIVANEFFDALPIRQFKYSDDNQWHEHYIENGKSIWIDCDFEPPIKSTLPKVTHNMIVEYSDIQHDYAKMIASFHGCALIIDYGYMKSDYGDSLQALYKHQYCPITDHVGQADLTTHIDFEWLATCFDHIHISTQGEFLSNNGIAIRYHQLNNPSLHSGYERLVHPDHMGNLFKVMECQMANYSNSTI